MYAEQYLFDKFGGTWPPGHGGVPSKHSEHARNVRRTNTMLADHIAVCTNEHCGCTQHPAGSLLRETNDTAVCRREGAS